MELTQIASIISGGETQEAEFKQSFHSTQDVAKAICAFANTFGGILIIGVSDKKEILGIKEDSDSLQQLIPHRGGGHPLPSFRFFLTLPRRGFGFIPRCLQR